MYLHHAPYSSGQHGSMPELRWPFRAWGASVVRAGHDHDYERLVADGLPYVVNGAGGRSLHKPTAGPVAESQGFFNADYTALLLDAAPDSLSLRFYTRRQQLIDTYVLHKALIPTAKLYPASPNPFQESTRVEFSLPAALTVQPRVLSSLGQEVAVLRQGPARARWHQLRWARNGLPAGLYYLQLRGEGISQVTVEID